MIEPHATDRPRGEPTNPVLRAKPMANSVRDVHNFREATPDLATSGQPREEELAAIAKAGYDVVINLALHDDPRYSLQDEASSVRKLGLEYIHIPVQFGAPTESDLAQFLDAMDRHKHRRVWVHCAANLRVTAFLGLYRCLREGWPEDRAFALLREIWQPDEIWSAFIAAQLGKSGTGGGACGRDPNG